MQTTTLNKSTTVKKRQPTQIKKQKISPFQYGEEETPYIPTTVAAI